mmetsp:Transcript_24446/g.46483  ORF Transcript_24446/g.46483 Transcript_24446/m.46483 type:complete len:235 (+) Transcript_24446:208-912(+)
MKVVFACKSNSCRSQMAEGWANEWVQQQRSRLTTSSSPTSSETEFLQSVVVASVALDSASVFKGNQEDGSAVSPSRISVKGKAVQAMAADGVDISSFTPKTLDELVKSLSQVTSPASESCEDAWSTLEIDTKDKALDGKPLDRLVVMYSCADNVKHHVVQHSRSVTEWSIEAPTAAAKAGEGDQAYRRVSLEIRTQVEALLEELMRQHVVAVAHNDDSSGAVKNEPVATEMLIQ